jgi:hypothetical protein
VGTDSFAGFLAGLDEQALAALLRHRPDVCVEPAPRDVERLAQRLGGPDSLGAALRDLNHDQTVVSQAVVALGETATLPGLARLVHASETTVRELVAQLCARGLAWESASRIHLPEVLESSWRTTIGGGRPMASLANQVRVDDLRAAARALGVTAPGARKSEVESCLSDAMSDLRALADVVSGLPDTTREYLDQLRRGDELPVFLRRGSEAQAAEALVAAGLVFRMNRRLEVPREVAVAAWLSTRDLTLTGPPELPASGADPASTRADSEAAVGEWLRGLSTLLDDAAATPLPSLKKGGVGRRERTRLVKRLALPDDETLVMMIDLASAAGLLGVSDTGYVPTESYTAWREDDAASRWASVAHAWFGLEHAPTYRKIDEDKELAPPVPLRSAAGLLRRALLRHARSHSVRASGERIDWFCPLHGYDPVERAERIKAAIREAERLGVVSADSVTELGEQLVAAAADAPADPVAELARRVEPWLRDDPCEVILQSDLTATVAGHPPAAVSRLLAASAIPENRGPAGIWRFTPVSVRAALDAGWEAEGLLARLREVSERSLPQPLEYLVRDVARRHGQVRVREVRACVVADEALVEEILNSRKLGSLHLARLASTVLSSPCGVDDVLERLRAQGFFPVPESPDGTLVVEQRLERRAPTQDSARALARPAAVPAEDLAARLRAGSASERSRPGEHARTLARLNPKLDPAEIELLADALDSSHDVRIRYRDQNGTSTVRDIAPEVLYGGTLDAWCHLRNGQREFSVARIQAVAPAT